MKKFLFQILGGIFVCLSASAQKPLPWNGHKAAVVLTYDDGYVQQLDNAATLLDSLHLKATFYLSGSFAKDNVVRWKAVADSGHELGNHTLYHPCVGGPGREWLNPDYDMRKYTVSRMEDEIRMENIFLQALDGKTERTFAFTCGDMKIGDSSFINGMKKDFVAARAVRAQMHHINDVDVYNVDCYMVNGETGEQLIGWAKKAEETNSLLVILFHGVGGGNSLNVSLSAHRQFLIYLQQHQKDLWVAPMVEVAKYIRQTQPGTKH